MQQPAARKTTRKTPTPDALLRAACGIVAAEGWSGLTLRPLAQRLGVSVTVLAAHYGNRDDVIAAVCRAAGDEDAQRMQAWRDVLASLEHVPPRPAVSFTPNSAPPLAPTLAVDLAEAILEEEATRQRELATLYLELLHAGAWDATARAALAAWSGQRRAFWNDFGRRAGIPAALIDSGWWHGYAIAETFYGLALDGDPSYRLLRRLCLQRLFAGGRAPGANAPDAILFARMGERMRHDAAGDGEAATAPGWVAAAARTCGIRLAMQGVGALTHRAIAADAGVAHTTLSYRFPTQHDLVVAGLQSITSHILAAVDAGSLDDVQRLRSQGDGARLDLARANLAVALAARRMPELVPRLAHMRARRGTNLARVFQQYLPDAPGIDALCAQVVSLGLAGLTVAEAPGEHGDASVGAAFAAAGRWLRPAR